MTNSNVKRKVKDIDDDAVLIKWLRKPFNHIIAITTTFSAIFLSGFTFGQFTSSNEHKLNIIELRQEFNEKIEIEKSICREETLKEYDKRIKKLEEVVNRRSNEK